VDSLTRRRTQHLDSRCDILSIQDLLDVVFVFQMASSVESDLTQQLETSSLRAAQNEIPIGKDAADLLKAQANEAFKSKPLVPHRRRSFEAAPGRLSEGDYENATELYSKAIEFHPDAILYSNRSFAYLRREWYGYALIDAKKALEYDSRYIKVDRRISEDDPYFRSLPFRPSTDEHRPTWPWESTR
jgi:tetratricopeptide (TPR) repeat protein